MASKWREAHPFRTDYNINESASPAADLQDDYDDTEEEERKGDIMADGNGFKTYMPIDESRVPASSVAFAEQVLKAACADAKLSVQNLEVKWFREVASGTFTRDTWVGVDCMGETGSPARGGWKSIWLRSDLDPRQICQVLRHECEHIGQHYHFGIEADVKLERDYYERMAMNAGVAFREKMLPSQMTQLQNRAAEVKRLYGPW